MTNFEQAYYENSAFWGEAHTSDADRARVMRVLDALPSDTESLLDVGCGDGICCNLAASRVPTLKRVVGLDRSLEAIKHVRVEKHVGDVGALPWADHEFDASVALEVLEHLPLPTYQAAVGELARVSKKHIVVTVPHQEKLHRNFARCPSCRTEFNRNLHLRTFDPVTMHRLFDAHGFQCESVEILTVPRHIGLAAVVGFWRRLQGRGRQMRRALCPVCGYSDERTRMTSPPSADRSLLSWKRLAKRAWPQVLTPRWLMGTYSRANQRSQGHDSLRRNVA